MLKEVIFDQKNIAKCVQLSFSFFSEIFSLTIVRPINTQKCSVDIQQNNLTNINIHEILINVERRNFRERKKLIFSELFGVIILLPINSKKCSVKCETQKIHVINCGYIEL